LYNFGKDSIKQTRVMFLSARERSKFTGKMLAHFLAA